MRHLFCPAGELAIAQLMRRHVLLAFDFDGTLAPIVARPDDARAPAAIARRLAALAQLCPVAVVTGRSIADVAPRLGFEPAYLVGNHGAEGLGWSAPGHSLAKLREDLQHQMPALQAAGVLVEDKGLSLALHYRLARNRDAALDAITAIVAGLPPDLASFGGKFVVNIVLRGAPDKGDAVLDLLRISSRDALLFVGDDVNDEAVFERARQNWLTVRIGRTQGASRAMFFLDTYVEMSALLQRVQLALIPPAG